MGKNSKFGNRAGRQANEGYTEVKTDMPADRFQGEKQVLNPDQLGGADSPVTGNTSGDTLGTQAKKLKSKITVRPDASVEMLDGKQVGGVPLEAAAVTRSVAGFSGQSVSDDTSKIPYQAGGYRPDTRYGKKRSEDLFELDNTVSEQIVPEVEDALDLRESPDSKMGYNGRKQFKQTRAKKNAVGLPQTLLFEASADFNYHNFTTATSGQMVDQYADGKGAIDSQADYPTTTFTPDSDDGSYADIPEANTMHKGNYLLKRLRITNDGTRITGIQFVEDKIPVAASKVTRDQANHNWQVDANNVAKSLIRMQTELGRETTEKWSPLGYVIRQPYQYNMLMHDIEATTGAIMFNAYRASVSSLSYQRNIIAKDGIGPVASAVRMFTEGAIGSLADSRQCDGFGFDQAIWNRAMYNRGSAAGLIAMFDSVRKYRTKADILGMQRSLALHLSQADNNINPFRMHAKYAKVVDKAHMFSTVDGSYNPLLPVHVTRKMDIINPLSLNEFLKGWIHPTLLSTKVKDDNKRQSYDPYTGLYSQYRYEYSDIRNSYMTRVQHPIVAGLVEWLLKHERAWCETFGAGTCDMPATFDFTAPSLFQFILCSASQQVAFQRNIIFRDILFAGEQSTYVWDDLTALKDIDPLHSSQLRITGYNEELKIGKLAPDSALRVMWSDAITTTDYDADNHTYTMPWYMTEQTFSPATARYSFDEGYEDEDSAFNMAIPSIRYGVRHEYVDMIKSMSENDVRLAMDRMLSIPYFLGVSTAQQMDKTNEELGQAYTTFSVPGDNSQRTSQVDIAAIRYDLNSDGRVIVHYDTDWSAWAGGNHCITDASIYAIPKELGFIWNRVPHLDEIITAINFSGNNTSTTPGTVTVTNPAHIGKDRELFSSVFDEVRSYRVSADAPTTGAIDRSAALSQAYMSAYSDPQCYNLNMAYTDRVGVVLNSSYLDGGYENAGGLYIPRSRQTSNNVGVAGFSTQARVFWNMLQRFCRPVNPFENCYDNPADIDYPVDPLEVTFYFGVCGFLASDYTQAVLERLDTFDQLGLDYTEDVNTKESLLFR